MKLCGRCKEEQSVSLFRKRTSSKDGLASWCNPCFAAYERERWVNGDKVRKTANKERTRKANRDYLWAYLNSHPCVDCGESDPIVLEFDHQGDKLYNIGMMHLGSLQKIKDEIAKCEVRCANCHRRRTAFQFNSWRTKWV